MATDTSVGGSWIAAETGIPQSNLKPISQRIKYLNHLFFSDYNCFVFVYGLYVKSLMAALATRTITEAGKITEDLDFHICHWEKTILHSFMTVGFGGKFSFQLIMDPVRVRKRGRQSSECWKCFCEGMNG